MKFPSTIKKNCYPANASLAQGLEQDNYANSDIWDSVCVLFMDSIDVFYELTNKKCGWNATYKAKDSSQPSNFAQWDDIIHSVVSKLPF
jgi:hypothetical protein